MLEEILKRRDALLRRNKRLYIPLFVAIGSLAILLTTWQLSPLIGRTTTYLLFIFIVTLNVWMAGLRFGFFTVIVAALCSLFFFLIPYPPLSFEQIIAFCEILTFILAGTVLCVIIEEYKKTNIINEYKKREDYHREKIRRLEEENQRIAQEIRLRDEFLSVASHELKTPLTSMLLKLQSVLHNIRNVSLANFSVEKLLKMLETAEQQTQRLSRMINDLLNVSLITTGKLHLELGRADVSELVKEVAEEFSEKLERAGMHLGIEIEEGIVAYVDKVRIEQVMTNLISNAIKYGDGKPLKVSVQSNDSFVKIAVKDHGIGIHPDKRKKIFTLFERGVSDSNYKGLGVGLYIAHQIIKAHNGIIAVKSKLNDGSTFYVELPLKQPVRKAN